MTLPQSFSLKRLTLLVALSLGLTPIGLALWPASHAAAAGVVINCSSPADLYAKMGGGGLVTFNCPGGGPITITIGELIPAGNTTLDGYNNGNPIILSGGGANRLFQHWPNGGGLTLTRISLVNGYATTDGGCIWNRGQLSLINVTITHCTTSSGIKGGAIYNQLVTNTLRLISSRIISNSAAYAGGILSYGPLIISNSQILENFATYDGGGIIAYGPLIISNSQVLDNRAFTDGGIIAYGTTVVSSTQFLNNRSGNGGGGLSGYSNYITVTNSFFKDNAAYRGGALYLQSSVARLSNLTLISNMATTEGGGINSNSGTLTLIDATVSGNSAYYGGGIHGTGTISLTDVTLGGNKAVTYGGGIYNAGTMNLNSVTVIGNSTHGNGGGIYSHALLIITNTTVIGNWADDDGGGIGNFGAGTARLTNVTLSGNTANSGGGISTEGTVNLTNVTLNANSAVIQGGGIMLRPNGAINMNGVTLHSNSASNGGGIYNLTARVVLTNVTLSGNNATNNGGGVYNQGQTLLRNVTLSGNSATSGGGLRNESGSVLVLTNTIVAYSPTGANCSGALTAAKYSIDSDNTCALGTMAGPGNLFADPLLTALGNYGGPTLVHMPKTGSPAIDGVVGSDAPFTDQRGFSHPVGPFDIGSVERRPGDSNLAPRLYLPLLRR